MTRALRFAAYVTVAFLAVILGVLSPTLALDVHVSLDSEPQSAVDHQSHDTSASSTTATTAETRVVAHTSSAALFVRASDQITAGQRLGNNAVGPEIVVATGVAANTGTRLSQDLADSPVAPARSR